MAGLRELVAEELRLAVDPRVSAVAAAIAARHGTASRAVLFYGSCLRQKQLEGLMLDFYLIVSDYRAAYRKAWLAEARDDRAFLQDGRRILKAVRHLLVAWSVRTR